MQFDFAFVISICTNDVLLQWVFVGFLCCYLVIYFKVMNLKNVKRGLEQGSVFPRLKEHYNNVGRKALAEKFKYENIMQVPKLQKIVVSTGAKEVLVDPKLMDKIASELMAITGQKPIITRAKKSIAGFKLKEGAVLGCKVTLRSNIMYEFLDRLVNIALPRVRDFKGFYPTQFDGRGNFSIGLKEQIIFPEINYDKVDKVRGMNIVVVTSARNNIEAKALLEVFNMPFIA
ncbi:large subunit ribosomal protein L5 [Alphaproteobacteria bacterium]